MRYEQPGANFLDMTAEQVIVSGMFTSFAVIFAIGWWQRRQKRPLRGAVQGSRSEHGGGNYGDSSIDCGDGPGGDGG